MKKLFMRLLVPVGLIILTFVLDLLSARFSFISTRLTPIIFWSGIGILSLLVLMEVIHWIIEFIKTEAQHGNQTERVREQAHSGNTN